MMGSLVYSDVSYYWSDKTAIVHSVGGHTFSSKYVVIQRVALLSRLTPRRVNKSAGKQTIAVL